MYSSWVEVSKSAILYNLNQYQKLVGSSVAVMPIVKSNAYGHGLMEVAKLVAPKVKWLGVVNLKEALALRHQGITKNIFVLSYINEKNLQEGIRKNIDLPVYDIQSAKRISREALKVKKLAKIHVKIDTGATRVGVSTKAALSFIKEVAKLPNIKIAGIYSHFAAAEDNQNYTNKQLEKFNQILKKIEVTGIKIPLKHFGCSAAVLTTPQSYFNLVRLGVSLYGLWPSVEAKKIVHRRKKSFNLKPALTWKTKILQVKKIPAGTKVGYGCSYTAKKAITMAVIAAGYWEGYDRHLSNKGIVVVKGKRCPVIGRVCMNISMIDISGVNNVKAGDEVVLISPKNSAEEMAKKIGTINYEVVTRINPLLERIYVK